MSAKFDRSLLSKRYNFYSSLKTECFSQYGFQKYNLNLLCTYKEIFICTINCCQPLPDTVCSIHHTAQHVLQGQNVIWHNMDALQQQQASSDIINSNLWHCLQSYQPSSTAVQWQVLFMVLKSSSSMKSSNAFVRMSWSWNTNQFMMTRYISLHCFLYDIYSE